MTKEFYILLLINISNLIINISMNDIKVDYNTAQTDLLSLNNDKVYWVYINQLVDHEQFVLKKIDHLLTCYDNQYWNLIFPDWVSRNNYPVQLVSLNELRKWKLINFDGKEINIDLWESERVILASWGVFPYVHNNNWSIELLASFRDSATGVDDDMLTTPAGRLIGWDLIRGINWEFAQESLYIWRSVPQVYLKVDDKWLPYILFPLLDEWWYQSLINWLNRWLENKYKTLTREKDSDKIELIENRLWIDKLWIDKYEELEKVFHEIISKKRFKQYEWKRWIIQWTEDDYRILKMNDWKVLSDANNLHCFTFFDEKNNTLEYRIAAEMTWLPPKWYELTWDMSGINLESNTPWIVKLDPLWDIDYQMVPTLKYLIDKIRKNSLSVIK